jgi:hypothetical protein
MGWFKGMWRMCVGFGLTAAMLITLITCAITFSARSFQHNFAQVSGNETGVVSLAAIARMKLHVDELERAKAPLQERLDAVEREEDALAVRYLSLEGSAKERAEGIDEALNAVEARLGRTDAGGIEPGALLERLEAALSDQALSAQDARSLAAARASLTELNRFAAQAAEAGAARDAARAEAREISAELQVVEERVLAEDAGALRNFSQILAEIDSLKRTSPFGVALSLAQVHPAFLSTLLVCLAGALGSLLYLFPAWLTSKDQVFFSDIVVRMLFGMLTAFGFMIVANAANSLLGLGAVETPMPQPSLNPFTIAGLGIIAGVMADDISKWIHQRAVYLIQQGGGGRLVAQVESAAVSTSPRLSGSGGAGAPLVGEASGGLVNPHGGPYDPV